MSHPDWPAYYDSHDACSFLSYCSQQPWPAGSAVQPYCLCTRTLLLLTFSFHLRVFHAVEGSECPESRGPSLTIWLLGFPRTLTGFGSLASTSQVSAWGPCLASRHSPPAGACMRTQEGRVSWCHTPVKGSRRAGCSRLTLLACGKACARPIMFLRAIHGQRSAWPCCSMVHCIWSLLNECIATHRRFLAATM